jgi:hypothetical protein
MRGTPPVQRASAALGAAGAVVALTAAPAVAVGVGPLVVSPRTGLSNNEKVSVSWDTGQAWLGSNHSAVAKECAGPVCVWHVQRGPACFDSTVSTLQAVPLANEDLGFDGTITVQRDPSPTVTCTNGCSVVILQGGNFSSHSSKRGPTPLCFCFGLESGPKVFS